MGETEKRKPPLPWLLHKREAWEEPLEILRRREMRRLSNWIVPAIIIVGATVVFTIQTIQDTSDFQGFTATVGIVVLFDYVIFFGSIMATYLPVRRSTHRSKIVSEMLATPLGRDRIILVPHATILDIWRYLLIAQVPFTVVISLIIRLSDDFWTNLAIWVCIGMAKAYLAYPSVLLALCINQRYLLAGSLPLPKILFAAVFHAIYITLISIAWMILFSVCIRFCYDVVPWTSILNIIIELCFYATTILMIGRSKEWCARRHLERSKEMFRRDGDG